MNLHIETIGYIGTLLIFISMTMSSLQKLRIFNILGSLFTILYSIIIAAYPIVLLNIGLALLNFYKLFTERQKGEQR